VKLGRGPPLNGVQDSVVESRLVERLAREQVVVRVLEVLHTEHVFNA
jgi:hypothetical protein